MQQNNIFILRKIRTNNGKQETHYSALKHDMQVKTTGESKTHITCFNHSLSSQRIKLKITNFNLNPLPYYTNV